MKIDKEDIDFINQFGLFEDPLSASFVYQIVRGEIIEHEESY